MSILRVTQANHARFDSIIHALSARGGKIQWHELRDAWALALELDRPDGSAEVVAELLERLDLDSCRIVEATT